MMPLPKLRAPTSLALGRHESCRAPASTSAALAVRPSTQTSTGLSQMAELVEERRAQRALSGDAAAKLAEGTGPTAVAVRLQSPVAYSGWGLMARTRTRSDGESSC